VCSVCWSTVLPKDKLTTRVLTHGRQQLSWQKHVTTIGCVDFDSGIDKYHTCVVQFRHSDDWTSFACKERVFRRPSSLMQPAFTFGYSANFSLCVYRECLFISQPNEVLTRCVPMPSVMAARWVRVLPPSECYWLVNASPLNYGR